jgi:hypothetical protein
MVVSLRMPANRRQAAPDLVQEYMNEIDRTLLRENLKLTAAQRLEKFAKFARFASKLRHAGRKTLKK